MGTIPLLMKAVRDGEIGFKELRMLFGGLALVSICRKRNAPDNERQQWQKLIERLIDLANSLKSE